MRLCERCPQIQKSCCQDDPRIILSRGDLARIGQATGADDFSELRYYPDLSFLREYDYDPNWAAYTVLPGNRRRQLRVNDDGSCVFLTAAGCSLPTAARPLMCRLHPHDYTEDGLRGLCSGDDLTCPVHLLGHDEPLDQAVGTPRLQAEEWRALLYCELRAEYEARMA